MPDHPPKSPITRFFYENSLSLVVTFFIIITIFGQAITGWKVYNEELEEMHRSALTLGQYVTSGHFIEAIFENWESEFLQMGLYVVLTMWLRQKGSSESKKLYEKEEVDREPKPKKDAPWPVQEGGIYLKVYSYSLSIAFFLLFFLTFYLHAVGGAKVYNLEQLDQGKETVSTFGYMATSQFWFESLQNWQSEFLSIVSIVVLSIFLRQKGSPESKPVDAPDSETED